MKRSDARLLEHLDTRHIKTISDVIACMQGIESILSPQDGIRWFNVLYRLVTEAVFEETKKGTWRDPAWLERLDVEFAELYFDALELWLRHAPQTPRVWAVMFEKRFSPGISRVQYAFAGLSAHIQRDLPVALVRSCGVSENFPQRYSPQETDFLRVNQVLDVVEVDAMRQLATGMVERLMHAVEPLDRVAIMRLVRRLRMHAWKHATEYWSLLQTDSAGGKLFIERLDRRAARLNAAVLVSLGIG